MSRPTKPEIRKARSYLISRGVKPSQIRPELFAGAAKELGVRFSELLNLIRRMLSSGQNQQFFRQIDIANAAKAERKRQ